MIDSIDSQGIVSGVRSTKYIAGGKTHGNKVVFIEVTCPIETTATIDSVVAATALENLDPGRIVAAGQCIGELRAADTVDPGKSVVANGDGSPSAMPVAKLTVTGAKRVQI